MSTRFCALINYLGRKTLIFCDPTLIPPLRGDKLYDPYAALSVLKNQGSLAEVCDKGTKPRACSQFYYPTAARRGFTLIELLIVIVIIGIVSSVTLYAFGDFGASRKARVAAEQFTSYLKLLEQRAILETSTFGININLNGYGTYRLNNDSKWSQMPQNSFFHWQAFLEKVIVHLESPIQNHNKKPDIIINPSGDMTAFKLFFGTRGDPQFILLVGKHNGDIVFWNRPKTEH